jgi:hypothetical protein
VTVVARTFISVPECSAAATWQRIVELIAPDDRSVARRDLDAVSGVACSCITDEALADDPLVVYGVGPRLRIYALYGDEAVEGDEVNESPLSFVPTEGDWHMSVPCLSDDLPWVQRILKAASNRVTARALGAAVEGDTGVGEDGSSTIDASTASLDVDRDAFFRR